ncbi:hypothetical protein ACIGXI_38710 [Kitasatospora aureofaciens]
MGGRQAAVREVVHRASGEAWAVRLRPPRSAPLRTAPAPMTTGTGQPTA